MCQANWYPQDPEPLCNFLCINGVYTQDPVTGAESCECNERWSGTICDTPCNPNCLTCLQEDEEFCLTCPGNQLPPECTTCVEFWYPAPDCDFRCVFGTYRFDQITGAESCACNDEWSGPDCDIPCKSTCKRCLQDDSQICTECPGNQKLDDCEECLDHWYEPLDCDFKCVNGTYVPANATTGDRERCDCNSKWSGEDCNTPCNARCERCLQDDPDACIECPGRQHTPECDTCWDNWFEPLDCDVECIIGQGVYDPVTKRCGCLGGWSGPACATPCNPNCTFCSQDDPDQCTGCPPNKQGELCDECVEFWFGDDCDVRCVNGTYEDGSPGRCICDVGWSGPTCDEQCNPACLTCAQDNMDLCLSCRGQKTGDLCELCIANWFPPRDCTVWCVNGTYVDGPDGAVPPGICACDLRWSGTNCNTPCHPN